jgi:uroporphyrinogen III methyltransferase/synthase
LDTEGREVLLEHLQQGKVDMVTFTSSSTVRNFKALLPENKFRTLMANTTLAAIGPITADTAHELGFHVSVVADVYTIPGLVSAVCRHFTAK